MEFPKEFIDEVLRATSISRILGKFITWDNKKTKSGKGDYWACCPFHAEKTPSFHATEKTGTYYCFSCHEKGNVLTFLQKSRGLSFVDSIKFLADEAGLQLPKLTGKEKEQADQYSKLFELNHLAAEHFQQQLFSTKGKTALEYLLKRGVSKHTIQEFGLGYSPWNDQLLSKLKTIAQNDSLLVDSGLAKKNDRGDGIYPTFRNRVIFPIKNLGGRVIAFGGRALDPKNPAKYLNSPNTAIFNKGSILYNLKAAIDQLPPDNPEIIVVEGYLDVIALSEFGFKSVVAPMGTALTEQQLQTLWKHVRSPIFAMDGDDAGLRAAQRIAELSLPLIWGAKGAKFFLLPNGKDPDDYIRQVGAEHFQKKLESAKELWQFLWHLEVQIIGEISSQRQDLINANLQRLIRTIKDASVRKIYKSRIEKLFFDTFLRSRSSKVSHVKSADTTDFKESLQIGKECRDLSEVYQIETLILDILVNNLQLISEFREQLEELDFTFKKDILNKLKTKLLELDLNSSKTTTADLTNEFGKEIFELLQMDQITVFKEILGTSSIDEKKRSLLSIAFRLLNSEHYCSQISKEMFHSSSNEKAKDLLFNKLKEEKLSKQKEMIGDVVDSKNDSNQLQMIMRNFVEQLNSEGIYTSQTNQNLQKEKHTVPLEELEELKKLTQ